MELHQLRVLREVADQGSIAAAARSLSVTPSAVSQVLSALQRQFPIALTERQGRSVSLTDAGRSLALAAIRVESAMEEAHSTIDDYIAGTATIVNISAFHSAAAVFFPGLLTAHDRADRPSVCCADEDVSQKAFPALTSQYDIVIAHRMSHSEPWPEERLRVVPLLREPLDVALRTDHRLARRRTLAPQDLVSENWVSTHEHFPPADLLRTLAATAGRPARIAHRINDFATAAAIVSKSGLLALLPRYTSALAQDADVVLRPVSGVQAVRNIDALLRPEKIARAGVRMVLETLGATARSLQQRHHVGREFIHDEKP